MSDIVTTETGVITTQSNPFGKSVDMAHINAGTVSIESDRAVAEAQGALLVAKRFQRDQATAFAKAMIACARPGLANAAMYSFPRGGQTVKGPTIRLAEELARCWGNIEYGIKELSQKDGYSEMLAFAWDLETNTKSTQTFTVKHERHKKNGIDSLTDPRDIYELTANNGARRLRARILAVLPPDLVESAIEKCAETLAGNSDVPLVDRAKKMVVAFSQQGVTQAMIEARLTHALDAITPDELVDMLSIYNAIKNNESKVSDWFGYTHQAEAVGKDLVASQSAIPKAPKQTKLEPFDGVAEGAI